MKYMFQNDIYIHKLSPLWQTKSQAKQQNNYIEHNCHVAHVITEVGIGNYVKLSKIGLFRVQNSPRFLLAWRHREFISSNLRLPIWT